MPIPSVTKRTGINLHCHFLSNSLSFVKTYGRKKLPLNDFPMAYGRYRKLWYLHEMEVDEFFLYQLWQRELTEEMYTSFVGWKKHILSLLALNPVQYRCLTENKIMFYAYCKEFGLPTPKIHAVYDPRLKSLHGIHLLHTIDDLIRFLCEQQIDELVIKPAEGTQGQSVLVLKFDREGKILKRVAGETLGHEVIGNLLKEYKYRHTVQTTFVIQERLRPHPGTFVLSEYVPFSYRVVTVLDEFNEPHILELHGKSAVGRSDMDNRSAGGLTLLIDDHGKVMGATSAASENRILERHPSNGFLMKGWEAPFYKEVCDLALTLARSFFVARCVGWDIAVSDKGVCVIEGNNPWSVLQQAVYYRGLWRGIFKKEAAKAIEKGPPGSPWW